MVLLREGFHLHRKGNDVTNVPRACKQHDETVDANTQPNRRWETVLKRAAKVLIGRRGLVVAGVAITLLCCKAKTLLIRIVQLLVPNIPIHTEHRVRQCRE